MNASHAIRGLTKAYSAMSRLGRFCITQPLPESDSMLKMLGLPQSPSEGDSILPRSMGRHTAFNANGRSEPQHDLPKIKQPITCWSQWNDWHGKRHEGPQTRTVEVLQRHWIPAPHEYLYVVRREDKWLISSRVLSLEDDSQQIILHIINVFKEIFRAYSITTGDLDRGCALPARRRHWKIVFDHRVSQEEARSAIKEILELLGDDQRKIIQHRFAQIVEHEPDFLAAGIAGFSDYVVFGFRERKKYVFESPNLNNATYVFGDEWRYLAELSKTQIREGALQHTRVIHDQNWALQFREAIKI